MQRRRKEEPHAHKWCFNSLQKKVQALNLRAHTTNLLRFWLYPKVLRKNLVSSETMEWRISESLNDPFTKTKMNNKMRKTSLWFSKGNRNSLKNKCFEHCTLRAPTTWSQAFLGRLCIWNKKSKALPSLSDLLDRISTTWFSSMIDFAGENTQLLTDDITHRWSNSMGTIIRNRSLLKFLMNKE